MTSTDEPPKPDPAYQRAKNFMTVRVESGDWAE